MVRGTWWTYFLWFGRTLASFIAAIILAFGGDLTGRVLNLLLGYPWPQGVHVTIHLVSIGVGAGIGGYLGWIIPGLGRYWGIAISIVVISTAITGVYLGRTYGPGVDPTYWWSRFAIDTTIHLTAAFCATFTATAIGVVYHLIAASRARSNSGFSSMTRTGPYSEHLQ